MTQKVNSYCWTIDLGSLFSLSWLKWRFVANWAPKVNAVTPIECSEILNYWQVLKWCLLISVLWSYLMVPIHWNWYIWSIMLKSAIISCFTYILYMKWLKITFCLLPSCSNPQRKLKFTGELLFTIRMIFWNFGVGYIF